MPEGRGKELSKLWDELEFLDAKRVQDSVWSLKYDGKAADPRDTLKGHIDKNDRLLVINSNSSA